MGRYQPGLRNPRFSIVIPFFNRPRELRRAVESCLRQKLADFEVILVDDGSTESPFAGGEFSGDARLKLIRHETNRGHAAARNTGNCAAAAEWIVSLDSDDVLLPGALARMDERIRSDGAGVERLAFMYRRDDGLVSPFPELRDAILDYSSYVAWLEGRSLYDFLACTKRFTFETVRWEERRWVDHCLYNLDFAKRHRTLCSSETLALVHTGGTDRVSRQRRDPRNALKAGAELGEEMDLILSRHGEALKRFAPRTFGMYRRMRASYCYLAGERWKGLKQSGRCLRDAPLSPDAWVIPLLGLASQRVFAKVRSWRPPAT